MWMPRLLFTVRRMMVAVVIVGIVIWGIVQTNRWRERARYYSARADFLNFQSRWDLAAEAHSRWLAETYWESGKRARFDEATKERLRNLRWRIGERFDHIAKLEHDAVRNEKSAALSQRRADYHSGLSEKYRRAARYPWLPVAPDPPEPE